MPELPEIETTLRGLEPHLVDQVVTKVIVRQPKLRWPIPRNISKTIQGHKILSLERRSKYIKIKFEHGYLLVHLGMSGRFRIMDKNQPVEKHDHVDFILQDKLLRYTDPRRFGCILWQDGFEEHKLLQKLGPEPLSKEFTAQHLLKCCHKRNRPIKLLIMDASLVVGVGNIYANEALFMAGIHPQRSAHTLTLDECKLLVKHIKAILKQSIKAGGTTLKDFVNGEGKPGYFQQKLKVYNQGGKSCVVCDSELQLTRMSNRQTVFCPMCQS